MTQKLDDQFNLVDSFSQSLSIVGDASQIFSLLNSLFQGFQLSLEDVVRNFSLVFFIFILLFDGLLFQFFLSLSSVDGMDIGGLISVEVFVSTTLFFLMELLRLS